MELPGNWLLMSQDEPPTVSPHQSALAQVQLPEVEEKIVLNPQTLRHPEWPGQKNLTTEAQATTQPSLPTSCLLLAGGPSAWAFYGHDMPISVFNFHSPFGRSEIPQR